MELSDNAAIELMEVNECRELNDIRPFDERDEYGIRRCLKCNCNFESEWAGNRICPECSEANMSLGPYAEFVTASEISLQDYASEHDNVDGEVKLNESYREVHDRISAHKIKQWLRVQQFDDVMDEPVREFDFSGLIIQNILHLPGPCDISVLPESALHIRAALNRRHLQAFHVEGNLTLEQVLALDNGISEGRKWVLISNKHISPESFSNKVISK